MTIQLYSELGDDEMYRDDVPHLPRLIVLDNQNQTKQFLDRLENLTYLGVDVRLVVAEIIEILQRDIDAEYELAYYEHAGFPGDSRDYLASDLRACIQVCHWYALELLKQFRRAKLYYKGMLYYQLRHIDSAGLVLEKLFTPILDLNDKKIKTHVSLAHRRRVREAALRSQGL